MTTSPWAAIPRIAYGGDYNPEQWPRETWHQDVALMREAGVNFVSVGIFSWALLELSEGEFDFGWLDDLLDLLHGAGISVALATPTASPPAWFFHAYPDTRVISREGTVMGFGSRGLAAPSSTQYRKAAVRIATELASRYAEHPAVVLWHVHNEYGVPVAEDYSHHAAAAFRDWLRERYGDLDGLNAAWGTAFWGQHYTAWEHINAPAAAPTVVNPAQRLDFARFSDHQLRQCFIAERDAIRVHADQPITTNFMAASCRSTDLFAWAREVDLVSNDHYLTAADPQGHIGLALAADLTRSVAGNKPWLLMEHSTSAVNWQPRNVAKRPGEMARNSLSHLARGADGIAFFQWRASRSGAEKFHSAMLPHAGTESRVWREVAELGDALAKLGSFAGSEVRAKAAILWDTESHWAQALEYRPSEDADPFERIAAFHTRLWQDGITCDFARPEQDLSGYDLVLAPASYLLTARAAENLTQYVAGGGTLVVSFFSGIVDEHDAVHAGGFLAPLREVLGVGVEEFLPLRDGENVTVAWADGHLRADVWSEALTLEGAEVLGEFTSGPAALPGATPGQPAAITRNRFGAGTAWYLATRLSAADLAPVLHAAYADAGLTPSSLPADIEQVVRRGAGGDFIVTLNHGTEDTDVPVPSHAVDLLTGEDVEQALTVPAGGYAVLHVRGEPDPAGDP